MEMKCTKKLLNKPLAFVERELSHDNGAFYSALDADSEGVEGKFYVWKKEELKSLLGQDYPLFAKYYNINHKGYWEEGNYILLKDQSDADFCKKENLELDVFQQKVKHWQRQLLEEREQRTRPALDDKSLTSWNALYVPSLYRCLLSFW
jgi:uncharacterized protein YyaL (SSP411 family)